VTVEDGGGGIDSGGGEGETDYAMV